tara:strand:+ start:189 stop:479 length:291 start_codon:yes stop_codon:yes gene_type:complete
MIDVNIVELVAVEDDYSVEIIPRASVEDEDDFAMDLRRFYDSVKKMAICKAKELEVQYGQRVIVDMQESHYGLPVGEVYMDNRCVASYSLTRELLV